MLKILSVLNFLATLVPAYAQETLLSSPKTLSLQVTREPASEHCRRIEASEPNSLAMVSLHRTFHDDFDEHPLLRGKWVPHYAGGAT